MTKKEAEEKLKILCGPYDIVEREQGNYCLYREDMYERTLTHILRARESYQGVFELPVGCTCCDFLFASYKFRSDKQLEGFKTNGVLKMNNMFDGCWFPAGFVFPDTFDTTNVLEMDEMFSSCVLPIGFTLGLNMTCANAISIDDIFLDAKMSCDFTLETMCLASLHYKLFRKLGGEICNYNAIDAYYRRYAVRLLLKLGVEQVDFQDVANKLYHEYEDEVQGKWQAVVQFGSAYRYDKSRKCLVEAEGIGGD